MAKAAKTVTPAGNWDPSSGWGFQLKDTLGRLSGGEQPIANALGAGRELGREFFDFGSLGRVGDSMPSWGAAPNLMDRGELGARYYAESFMGGQRPAEAQESLDRLKSLYDINPNTQKLIDERMSRLGGMSTAEESAIRDSAVGSLNQGMASALRSLRSQYSGAAGPAAMRAALPLTAQGLNARSAFENQLVQQKMTARNQALADAENLMRGVQADRLSAAGGYENALMGRNQFETADRANRLNTFANWQTGQLADVLGRQQYNLGQIANEKAGQLGLLFGSGAFGADQLARKQSMDIAREGINAMR